VRLHSLIALAVTATSALAQTPVGPQPDGRRLRLGGDSLEIYVVRLGQPKRTGFLIDRLDTVRVNGETRLRRIYRVTDSLLGSRVDTLVDAFATLQPRTVRSRSDRGIERLDWQTSRVIGVVEEPDSPTRSVDSPLPAVPTFSGFGGSRVLTAKVVGSEAVEGYGDTWRIDADFAGLQVTMWVSKSSRRMVRQVMHVSPVMEIIFVAPHSSSSA
jgi:hypothetical protein